MTAGYRFVEAEPEHPTGLRAIELAAASLLAPHAATSVAETTPDEVFREAFVEGAP